MGASLAMVPVLPRRAECQGRIIPRFRAVKLPPCGWRPTRPFLSRQAHAKPLSAFTERCRSGRTGRSRKPLSSLRGTEGSNPSLSATFDLMPSSTSPGRRIEITRMRTARTAGSAGNVGIVDQHIELAELSGRGGRHFGPAPFFGDFERFKPRRGTDAIGHPTAFMLQHVGDHHLGAFARKQAGGGRPYAGRRTGNDGNFARKSHCLVMRNPGVVEGFLDAAVPGLDDLGGNG